MGYDPDRFDHIDDFWVCKICHDILKDPVLGCRSDHILCRDCTLVATACPWPDCEEKLYDAGFKRDLTAARFIDTLIISCEECDWRGPVAHETEHADSCVGRKVQCSNMNCTVSVTFGDLCAHLDVCPEGLVPCANNPACTHMSRRIDVFQHGLNCEFNACRWNASGCGFRGSAAATAAHEVYCTEIHEELARLRAVAKEFKRAEKRKRREDHRAAREAAQRQIPAAEEERAKAREEARVRKEEKLRRREQRKSGHAARKNLGENTDTPPPVPGTPSMNCNVALTPQVNCRASELPRGVSVSSSDHATGVNCADDMVMSAVSLNASNSTVVAPPSTTVNPLQVYEPTSLHYPLIPASQTEGQHNSHAATAPTQTKTNDYDASSIVRQFVSPTLEGDLQDTSLEKYKGVQGTTPIEQTSLAKKRSRDDAGPDPKFSAGTMRKKVRIRLPSPFLQPDADEESEGDTAVDGKGRDSRLEDWDSGVDADEPASDAASEELGDLLVTSVANGTGAGTGAKLSEEGEVEQSIRITFGATPTPASLLAKYQALKPIYMHSQQYASRGCTDFGHLELSQEYPDFSPPPLGQHYPIIDELPKIYERPSMSPVMRSKV